MQRILIADRHAIIRRGVRDVIAEHPGWEVCGEAADGNQALALAKTTAPNIAIVGVSLPGLGGISLTRRLQKACPSVEVLAFTGHDDDETIGLVLQAGARGYVLKADGLEHLAAAIAALAAGRPYFSPVVSEVLLNGTLHDRKRSVLEDFTSREIEIAQLIAEGNANKQIARSLNLSIKTVESHRGSVLRKAGVSSAAGMVRFAVRHNLIVA